MNNKEVNQKTTITEENGQWSVEIENNSHKSKITQKDGIIEIEADTITIQ